MQGELFHNKILCKFHNQLTTKRTKVTLIINQKYFVDDGYDGGGGIVDYKSYLLCLSFSILNFD